MSEDNGIKITIGDMTFTEYVFPVEGQEVKVTFDGVPISEQWAGSAYSYKPTQEELDYVREHYQGETRTITLSNRSLFYQHISLILQQKSKQLRNRLSIFRANRKAKSWRK